ncbi:hypothetical protein ISN76_13185 [Dyella halodurans]|uniref:Uncharacterized protein n=1 Tax=Dyella halodurans TaxID=1920171 RepID=A0ABV9C0C2_9GAMM|nr:hypothetical protein [Dyella halodurans]
MRELHTLMSGGRIAHRPPRKVAGFTWSRVPGLGESVTYRLFRRDLNGTLHVEMKRFDPANFERCQVATEVNQLRHKLRDRVDALDLKFLGVTV